jgi:hypothetical protein
MSCSAIAVGIGGVVDIAAIAIGICDVVAGLGGGCSARAATCSCSSIHASEMISLAPTADVDSMALETIKPHSKRLLPSAGNASSCFPL